MEIHVLLSAERMNHLIQLSYTSMSRLQHHKGIHECYNSLLLQI